MPKLNPTAVVGKWINEARTRGFMLQANGDLLAVERETPSDMWSPPETVGQLQGGIDAMLDCLASLTMDGYRTIPASSFVQRQPSWHGVSSDDPTSH